jgi:hypothetical protein
MSPDEILGGVAQVARIVRLAGLKGFVIALDEAETIPSIGGNGIERGYNNLAALIKASEQSDNTYFIYATTPTFFRDVRVYSPAVAAMISDRTRVDLQPLSRDDMVALAGRIGRLFEIAEDGVLGPTGAETLGRQIVDASTGPLSVRGFVTKLFETIARE